jgi:D-alanine transaminase
MKDIAYYNGEIAPVDEMKIPMNDRACFFGDGVYEATTVRNYKIFALREHLDRLYSSAAQVEIEIPCKRAELEALLYDIVRKLDAPDQMLYWQVTRGTAPRNHIFPPRDVKANLWITSKPFKVKGPEHTLTLCDIEDTRFLHCNIKTLNLMINCIAATKAEREGCDECVFHRGEYVTECAHSNIHILKDGVFVTHPADNLILPGITRKHLIGLCNELDVPVCERAFTMEELYDADEVFVSSATKLCKKAVLLNGKAIGGKAERLAEKIMSAYYEKYLRETD